MKRLNNIRTLTRGDLPERDAEFAGKSEIAFAELIHDVLQAFLKRTAEVNARIELSQYDGVVLDKPSVRIQIGDSEFQLLIIKS